MFFKKFSIEISDLWFQSLSFGKPEHSLRQQFYCDTREITEVSGEQSWKQNKNLE